MAWDDSPPTKDELATLPKASWDSAPPTQEELKSLQTPGQSERPWYAFDPSNIGAATMADLKKIDQYTGAPVRKFVTEAVTGKTLDKAPTGAEQAKMMGATDKTYGEAYGLPSALGGNISPADIYGVGLEAVQDPLLIGGKVVEGAKGLLAGGQEVADALRSRQALEAAQSQGANSAADIAAKTGSTVSGGDLSVEQGGKLFNYKAPKNLDELNKWTPASNVGELPGKDRLAEIENIVPDLQAKPLKYHYDMMDNPKAMKDLKLQFENLPTDSAKKIASYNQAIVDESADKIQQTVNDLSPSEPKSLTDAGNDLISTVKDKYNGEKEALAPIFDKIQQSAPLTPAESKDLAIGIGENSKLGKIMSVDPETNRVSLAKNTPRTGLSDAEHGALSRVVDDLNDGMTFKEIQNSRDFLRKAVDPANPGASTEINKVRSVMLGQLEDMASKRGEDVGKTFKDYAVNERARENVEKVIGGSIDSLDKMYAANPDNVVKKVFSNPNYTKVVGEYVGPEKMNEMVQSYVNNGVQKSFDSAKGFDPSKLKTWMKSNSNFLKANVDSKTVERLGALADYGYYGKRFLDEVNPSGTAASMKEMVDPQGFFQKVKQGGIVHAVESSVAGKVQAATQQRQAIRNVNEAFGTPQPPTFSQNILNYTKGASDISKDGTNFQNAAATARGTIKGPSQAAAAADKNQPTKGPDKWANDGLQNLIKHDSDFSDPKIIQLLKSSQKGKDLLIKASDLRPGTKAMDNLVDKIRSSNKIGDE